MQGNWEGLPSDSQILQGTDGGAEGEGVGGGRVEGGTLQQLVQLCGLCCPPFLPLNCSLNSLAFMATWTSPGVVRL